MGSHLLHIVAQHPGGIAVDYASVAIIALGVGIAFYAVFSNAQPAARAQTRRAMPRRGPPEMLPTLQLFVSEPVVPELRLTGRGSEAATPLLMVPRFAGAAALSYLFLLILGIQGFHVMEHFVLVVQVEALGTGLDRAHGLLGAQVDFEWLHFSYNLSFLAALVLLLAHGLRLRRQGIPVASWVHVALIGAVALQSYHMVEHTIRIIQYYQTDCAPCVGLIGQVVLFIWPHLFFGVFAYGGMLAAFFGYGLHRGLFPRLR